MSSSPAKQSKPYRTKFKPVSKQSGASPFMQLTKSVWLIPGENPGQGYLCGTNVFVVGSGKSRVMIDACTKNVPKFISNINEFCKAQDCSIDKILITHGHHDHYAGAYDVVELLLQQGFSEAPKVYKHVIQNLITDQNRLNEHPELDNYLYNTREGDVFELDNGAIKLSVIESPGHIDDHLCFLLEEQGEETMMFTGDHIIGADSTFFSDYPKYIESLEKIRVLTEKHDVKRYLVAHSYTLTQDDILIEAKSKIVEQIEARRKKDEELEEAVNKLGKFSLSELYDSFHSHKGIQNKPFETFIKMILQRRLQKLIQEWKLREENGRYIIAKL